MSDTTSSRAGSGAPFGADRSLRFGRERRDGTGSPAYEWVLGRNCSMKPGHMLLVLAVLGALPVAIGVAFALQGASLVLPFASAELLAIAAALLVYARHAADSERIALSPSRLTVEHIHGARVERVTLRPAWVRVEPRRDDRSLVELSSLGQRVAVGRFVRPELRPELAAELRSALARCGH